MKKLTLRNTLLAYIGYMIPISATYLGKFLHLTTVPYSYIHYLFLLITITNGAFYIFTYSKDKVSFKFGQYIGIVQLLNWLIVGSIWIVVIHELRIIALLNSLIPFMFFFAIGNLASSLAIVTLFSASYLLASYYSIHYLGQSGTITREVFYTYCFYYSSVFIVFMSQNYKKQRKLIKKSQKKSDMALKQLEISNRNLKQTYENIKTLLTEISTIAVKVTNEARNINRSSEAVSQGTEHQAAAINEIAKAMGEIDRKTSDNAGHSEEANHLAWQAQQSSEHGVLQMQKVNEAMLNIHDSSNAISKIIKTIDDISFQTNLLSLNAAIEAARAGRHGKGFGVVAQEVRNLAAKSAEAANMTTDLIEKSLKMVETGTLTSKTAVAALDTIHDNIETVTHLVEKITDSSIEQTSSISQVNHSMRSILDITERTAKNAKETTLAANNLNQTADKIRLLIQSFEKDKTTQ